MSFKSVQNKIAKSEGVSKKSAGAILANSSRNASAAAKKKNPKLKKVKGGNEWAGPMKSESMTYGRDHNLAAKDSFVKTDARGAGMPNQDESLSAARSHNSMAKSEFKSGAQRAANLMDDCKFDSGKQRSNGKL
jgi:hypothetical protein